MRIFLIGFMGTGKSHWGRLWAAANGLGFIDLDEAIEAQEGRTVAAIFETKGEKYFRDKEAAMLRCMDKCDDHIISCGGGSPCFFNNIEWMNANGITVLLAAGPQYVLKNIKSEKEKRPLLKETNESELLFFIETKLKERMPFYNKAKLILNAEELNVNSFNEIAGYSLRS